MKSSEASPTGHAFIDLNKAQLNAVQSATRQIIPNPDSAKFSSAKAINLAGEQSLHVCGHVRFRQNGSYGKDLPYYMELKDGSSKPEVKRGQVGDNPSRLSKVRFMCRRHGDI